MNLADTEQTSGSRPVVSNTATTRLSGSWLHMARAVWLALVVPSLGLFVVGLPVYYQQLQRAQVCGPGACLTGGLSVKDLQDLVSHGFSVGEYAAEITIFIAIIAAIWCAADFLLLNIIYAFCGNFPSPISPFNANWPGWLTLPIYLVLYGPIIFSQIYRYRRVSTPTQRQQTKWVVFGVTVFVGVFIGLLLISSIPSLYNSLLLNEVWTLTLPIASLAIPLSIGFSILRYRLYDIDVLINRTLVYGTLTISLALVYVGLVIGLGSLVRLFTGQLAQSPVVIVASTLAIAALFQPLRQRIQAIIDHRFYRRKYDAARTVAAFSATLRNEVELTQISEHLVAVVRETMQPERISLWLRKSDHERKPNTLG